MRALIRTMGMEFSWNFHFDLGKEIRCNLMTSQPAPFIKDKVVGCGCWLCVCVYII